MTEQAPEPRAAPPDRPRATWTWWEAAIVFVVAQLAAGIVLAPFVGLLRGHGVLSLVGSVIADAMLLAVFLGWLAWKHPDWKRIVGFPRDPLSEIWYGATAGALLTGVILFVIGPLVQLALEATTTARVDPPPQLPADLSGVRVVLAVVLALLVAPLVEELVFRGVLFSAVRDRYGVAIGVVASGAAFGLVHFAPSASWQSRVLLMAVVGLFGMGLAWMYHRRGNLVASIAAHVVFNVVGLWGLLAVFR